MAENQAQPLEEEEDDATGLTVYDIRSLPNDWNIESLVKFIDRGSFTIPPFQRNFTWNKKQASSLIESLIMGLPIPQLFLFEHNKQQLLIDGQQRLSSIYFFYKQRFPRKDQYGTIRSKSLQAGYKFIDPKLFDDNTYFEDFRLQLPKVTNVEQKNDLHGIKYSELSIKQQWIFDMRTLRTITITQFDPKPEHQASSMYEIFKRLNTGGTKLTPQEVRRSIFDGPFYQLLDELNRKPQWQKLLGQNSPDNNYKDIEYLLRCFALADAEEYKPPMARFLNTFSLTTKDFTEEQLAECRQMFANFLNSFTQPIESYNLKSNDGRFLVTILDALFTAWAQLSCKGQVQVSITVAQFDQLKKTIQQRLQQTNLPTTNKGLVEQRIQTAKDILAKV